MGGVVRGMVWDGRWGDVTRARNGGLEALLKAAVGTGKGSAQHAITSFPTLRHRNELLNARRLSALLPKGGRVSVPAMHSQLSGPRLIVMEWIDGAKITDLETLKGRHINPRAVSWGLMLVSFKYVGQMWEAILESACAGIV